MRGVRGSSGGTEQGGSAGGGLGLCRVRIKLSPGIQQGCLSDPCRCSAVAAGGHGRSSPARLEGRWREGREEGGEEPVRSGGQGRAGSGSAGRGESTAPRQSCRQPRAGMTKAARYSPAVCAGSSRSASSPARTVLQSRIPAAPPAHRQLPGCQAPCLLKVTAGGACSKHKVLMGSSVPALPPPPPPPWAGGLYLLRELSILWLGQLWEEAGAVLGEQRLAGCSRAAGTSAVPELQPERSAQPYLVGSHVEGGRSPPRRAAAWHVNPPGSASAR